MAPGQNGSNGSHANVPDQHWAQIADKEGAKSELKQIPTPKPGPDEVLVNIKYSGVCHTDWHVKEGDWPLKGKFPLVGGHEGAGVVVAKGELVKDVEIGDHVGVKWINGTCLQCDFCQQSDEPLCQKAVCSGAHVDGTFQQYCIAQAAHVARIPKDVSLEGVAPVLCAGITVYKGLRESQARPGQTVAIVGAGGGLGSMAVQYATAMGLRVIAIDGGEEKKAACTKLGAEHFVDFTTSKDVVKDVQACTADGLGPHGVLLVAVQEKPFQQAAEYVRPRGTVVCIGLPANAYLKAPVFSTVAKMVTIRGSYVGNRRDSEEAIDFYRRGLVKIPYKVVGLSELENVYDLMLKGQISGRYVLDTSK